MGIRVLNCALAALVVAGCGGQAAPNSPVPAGTARVRCVNTASGAAWPIELQDARALADGQPARFAPGRIDWSNPSDGGLYHLDRASGRLTVTRASSTGGYIVVYRCAVAD